jgi:hypothetical protein
MRLLLLIVAQKLLKSIQSVGFNMTQEKGKILLHFLNSKCQKKKLFLQEINSLNLIVYDSYFILN